MEAAVECILSQNGAQDSDIKKYVKELVEARKNDSLSDSDFAFITERIAW